MSVDMPLSPSTVVLVVPCFNEEHRLRRADFLDATRRYPWLRLLLVDDGSRDATQAILEAMAAQSDGRSEVLVLAANVGKAEAVRQGLLRAFALRPAFVGYWDADLATPFDALPGFMGVFELRPWVDVVLGSRVMLLGRNIRRSTMRHYVGRVFATGASFVLDLPVYDTQCGAKLFRATPRVQQALERPFVTKWIFDVELLARLLSGPDREEAGDVPPEGRIYELPLDTWIDEPGSKVRASDGLRAAVDLLRVYRLRLSTRGRPSTGGVAPAASIGFRQDGPTATHAGAAAPTAAPGAASERPSGRHG